eukprot:gene19963-30711_t
MLGPWPPPRVGKRWEGDDGVAPPPISSFLEDNGMLEVLPEFEVNEIFTIDTLQLLTQEDIEQCFLPSSQPKVMTAVTKANANQALHSGFHDTVPLGSMPLHQQAPVVLPQTLPGALPVNNVAPALVPPTPTNMNEQTFVEAVQEFIEQRERARRVKDYAKADAIREHLRRQGIKVNDDARTWLHPNAVNLLLVWCVMDRMERFLHMVHAGFAIGALIGPVVVREIGFNIGFTFLGLFAIATSIAAMFVLQPGKPSDETAPAVDKEEREERSTVQWVLALLIAAHLYLYIGMEEGYGAVIYSMASEDYGGNLSHHESTGIDTIFWAAMAVGRTAAGPLSVRYNLRGSRMLMLAASGMVVASSLHAAVPNTRFALWFGSALMGLSQAPVFPASIATLEYAYPITPTITTFMVMFAAAGSISVPPLLLYVYSERENTGLMGVIFMIFSISSLTLINAFTCVEKKMRSNLLTITSETLSQYKVQADEALDEEAKDDNSFHPPREVRV